jgi:hypothetical protein
MKTRRVKNKTKKDSSPKNSKPLNEGSGVSKEKAHTGGSLADVKNKDKEKRRLI